MKFNLANALEEAADEKITFQIKVQSTEDLPSAVLRYQINELKKKLDSSVYRIKKPANTKRKS